SFLPRWLSGEFADRECGVESRHRAGWSPHTYITRVNRHWLTESCILSLFRRNGSWRSGAPGRGGVGGAGPGESVLTWAYAERNGGWGTGAAGGGTRRGPGRFGG